MILLQKKLNLHKPLTLFMDNIHISKKADVSLKLLSDGRVNEIFDTLVQTLFNIRKSDKLEYNKAYPLELTKAFDQEEPTQFIYAKCTFSVIEKIVGENDSIPRKEHQTQISIEDIEIFKQEEMFEWLDYVNRITKESKEDSLYSENSIFKNEDANESNGDENKNNKSTLANIKKNIPKGFFKKSGNDLNPEDTIENSSMDDEDEDNDIYDFYDEDKDRYTEEEYLDKFRMYSKNAMNSVMDGYLNPQFFSEEMPLTKICLIDSLKDLQNEFSNCDFWTFKKESLLELGFTNFANKLLLIPLWAFPIIGINGIDRVLGSKDGNIFTFTEDSKDFIFSNCYGCFGSGILIKDLPK